jgi:phenylalanyl-tRNA synthetase beta chain
VLRPIDLVEEFIRLHGTDSIPAAPVRTEALHRGDDPVVAFNQKAATFLVAQGGGECYHYTLRSGEEVQALWGDAAASAVALKNPLASDQGHLRPSLLPGLLDSLQYNLHRSNNAPFLFESGHVFRSGRQGAEEWLSVAFVLLEEPLERFWKKRESVDFFTVKYFAEQLAQFAGINLGERWTIAEGAAFWQSGHAAEVSTPMYHVCAGLVNMSTLKQRWGLRHLVYAGEVCFNPKVLGKGKGPKQFQAMSAFPPVARDVSLIVDHSCSAESVRRKIESAATKAAHGAFLVESVDLFDLYSGKGLPEGKKSLGFSLRFRATDRTLKDDEVARVFDTVCKKITETGDYVLRDS